MNPQQLSSGVSVKSSNGGKKKDARSVQMRVDQIKNLLALMMTTGRTSNQCQELLEGHPEVGAVANSV